MLKYVSEQDMTFSVEWDKLVTYLRALAEPNRLRIFTLLMEGKHCNCRLGEKLGLPPNLISHHLAILRQVGLVEAGRDATDSRWIYYSVNRAALEWLNATLQALLDPNRIQQCQLYCAPQVNPESSAKETIER